MRRLRTMLVVIVVAAGGLGLFAPPHALGGCVAPSVSLPDVAGEVSAVDGEQVPVYTVALGDRLTVEGEYFFDGCSDVTVSSGCTGPSEPPPAPSARSVPLILAQAGHHWTLGTADAAGEDELWAITWTAALPDDLEAGPAKLTAMTAELNLIITPRTS